MSIVTTSPVRNRTTESDLFAALPFVVATDLHNVVMYIFKECSTQLREPPGLMNAQQNDKSDQEYRDPY